MKIDVKEEIAIPEKVRVNIDGSLVAVKGPKGEVKRELKHPRVSIKVENGKVILESKNATRREKKILYTFVSHIKNMLQGVLECYAYKLKICAAHFPMNASVAGNEFIVKNFLGENSPRKLRLREGVNVKVDGDIVSVESADLELAGLTASQIELLTRIRNRDRRVYQDGIFIISKGGNAA